MTSQTASSRAMPSGITVRPLRESELPAADHLFRLAFGTYLGLADPLQFTGDANYIRTRWLADPEAAFAAELGGELAGINLAARWGSVGFFGPLAIRPDLWGKGIAQLLLGPTIELFDRWGVTHSGLYTFAASAKHVGLYQKFGFWPRFLTALLERPVGTEQTTTQWTRFSALSEPEKMACLEACRELTGSVYDGLDLEREILAVDRQHLGETLLTWNVSQMVGLAVCHAGRGTEAGSGKCYVKFACARGGPGAAREFRRLLHACREFALAAGATTLTAGMNLARLDAYREILGAGFRATTQGVAMERDGNPGYNRPDVFLIDDWR
jgi:GNAT superfamily N-acetyltransferase